MGSALICGGATESYVDCQVAESGAKRCERNTQCVTTAGGTEWCTGPKSRDCLEFDIVSNQITIIRIFPTEGVF